MKYLRIKMRAQMGPGMGTKILIGLILAVIILVGASMYTHGDPMYIVNQITADPLTSGALILAGVVFGAIGFRRTY